MAKWLVIIWFAAVLWWAWREGQKDALEDEELDNTTSEEVESKKSAVVEKRVTSRPVKAVEGDSGKKVSSVAKKSSVKKAAVKKGSAAKSTRKADDLKKIEGIGPKLAALLVKNKIKTYAALAATSESDLEEMIKKAKLRIPVNAKSWISQARELAAEESVSLTNSKKKSSKK